MVMAPPTLTEEYVESEASPVHTLAEDVKITVTDKMKFGAGAFEVWESGRVACEAVKDISFNAEMYGLLEHPLHVQLVAAVVAEIASPPYTTPEGEEEPDNPPNRVDDIEVENPDDEGVKEVLGAGRDAIMCLQSLESVAWHQAMQESYLYRDLKRAILAEASGNLPESARG